MLRCFSAEPIARVPVSIIAALVVNAVIGAIGSPAGWAQLDPSQRDRLIRQSESERQSIGDRPFPSAETEAEQVLAAIDGVRGYLASRSSPENAAKWLRFLRADSLAEAIQAGLPREAIAVRARAARSRLIGDHRGLELASMTALRDQVDELLGSLRFESQEASVRLVDQQAEALQRRLRETDPIPAPEDAAAIAGIVALLDQSGQMPSLVEEVRVAFSQPNVFLAIDAKWISELARRPVDQSRPIRDCILGTTVIGSGRLLGDVQARLAPNRGSVQIDLALTGTFRSDTVGYNGPVRLPAIGQGQASAFRTVWVDETGLRWSPTTGTASMTSRVLAVQHPLKIVRKLASRQVAEKQPSAERIAERRLLEQVSRDFERQTSEAAGSSKPLSDFEQRLNEARVVLTRFNVSEPTRTIGSTVKEAYLEATVCEDNQLTACNPPPAVVADQGLVRLQVHESLVDNLATRVLAGRTVTGQELDRLLAETGREPPAESEESDESSQFEIDFSGYRPVICELRDQTVRIGIRGTRFHQGDRELKRPLEITATYLPTTVDSGEMRLVRTGEISVDFPGTRRLTVEQIAVRRTLQRLFAKRFPESLLDRPIEAPPRIEHPQIRGRMFYPSLIDAQDGWLSIAVR